jgi:hypothetical protein
MIVSGRSGSWECAEIDGMRMPVPGRTSAKPDPAASQAAPDPEEAAATSAPAPEAGRGPKVQVASRKLAIASAQFLLIVAAIVVFGYVLGRLWSILLPIVLGLLIATVLWPATRFLRNHRWPPALAAATVLLAFLAALGGLIAAIAPSVADQVTQLADQSTAALQDVQDWLQGPPFNFGEDQIGNAVDSVIK